MKSEIEVNKIKYDDFGRPTAILAVNKPSGVKSHDVVDMMRKAFNIRQVGHAGALDPFASGLLIILLGKATKYSDDFLKLQKEYIAEVVFGVSTDTGDIDGTVVNYQSSMSNASIDKFKLESILKTFSPSYSQYVPVFSSVKVAGEKLRVLARKYNTFEIVDTHDGKAVRFFDKDKTLKKEIPLPSKLIQIYEIELLDLSMRRLETACLPASTNHHYPVARIRVRCSKGTYIRQLAVDIGEKLGEPSMLITLERTKVGEISLKDSLTIDQITSGR